jgi:hypothetical protein
MFTLLAAVSLNELLPKQSSQLVFPLNLLSDDESEEEYSEAVKVTKKDDNATAAANKKSSQKAPVVYRVLIR